ncbi:MULTISPECIES: hypothetical protein [Pseudomonas]|jgi:hypothetical protein|uniref:Uncharacterized protein n=1 Tax=Pseudomonas sp. Hg7Tf TaxID=3236988 RepID=A0AB39I8F7_9PSED|nr:MULTISPECIES: hypothetical protein [Pseudomonas]MDD1976107.1 hypothetical protein [Pseudomonas putida]MDH2562017.1 hypothetical protein [Pseudomonas sp. Hg5Tf]
MAVSIFLLLFSASAQPLEAPRDAQNGKPPYRRQPATSDNRTLILLTINPKPANLNAKSLMVMAFSPSESLGKKPL